MKILQLITKRQPRGAETFAVQLANELAEMGHSVVVAALYEPAKTPLSIASSVKVVDLSDKQARAIPHLSILRKIASLIRQEEIEIVQANASDNLKYALLSRGLFRWKAPIVYRNASIMSAWLRSTAHRAIYGRLLQSVEAIASVSKRSKEDIETTFGVSAGRVHHLGIAVYLPEDAAGGQRGSLGSFPELEAGEETKFIFHVGAFTPEKNHAGLMRIFSMIRERCDFPVRLICIGNGPLLDEIRQGAPAGVTLLGFRTDVPDLLPQADLLLLPSLIEGTPGVVLEAQANRVVPVAYRVGAMDECYPEDLYGELTVEKEDEEGMARTAFHLLTNSGLRQRYADRLHTFVANQYAMRKVAKKFAVLYGRTVDQYRN